MQIATLEHVNITVKNPHNTAAMLCRILGWHIRWEGPSMDNGYTVHVGTEASYLALYSTGKPQPRSTEPHKTPAGLNHIALVVEDLDLIEARVKAEGYKPHSYGDYEPGRRFYFYDTDNVEYEIVSYVPPKEIFKRDLMRQLGIMARFGALAR